MDGRRTRTLDPPWLDRCVVPEACLLIYLHCADKFREEEKGEGRSFDGRAADEAYCRESSRNLG